MTEDVEARLLTLLQQFVEESERYVDAVCARGSMHKTDLNALSVMLAAVRQGHTVTPGTLRRALNLSSPATTALIDRLDNSGHVTRSRSSVDRRQVELELTTRAITTGSTLFTPLATRMLTGFGELDAADLKVSLAFMEKAVAAAISARHDIDED